MRKYTGENGRSIGSLPVLRTTLVAEGTRSGKAKSPAVTCRAFRYDIIVKRLPVAVYADRELVAVVEESRFWTEAEARYRIPLSANDEIVSVYKIIVSVTSTDRESVRDIVVSTNTVSPIARTGNDCMKSLLIPES